MAEKKDETLETPPAGSGHHSVTKGSVSGTGIPGAQQPGGGRVRAQRPTLIQSTIRQLMNDIMTGTYGAGAHIAETELAERLDVSRSTVREALRTLEKDGLVELTPWRGACVIDPAPVDITAQFELLGAVYGIVARLVVRNTPDAALVTFSKYVDQFERCQEEGQGMLKLLDIAYRAGTYLGQNCGSTVAADNLRSLGRGAYWSHRFLQHAPRRVHRESVAKFRKLETALYERSEQKSETAARKFVQLSQRTVMRHVN